MVAATSMQTPNSSASISGSSRKRFCWECQRRRLVCDSARPICSRCKLGGIVCPGYEDKKPLTWVAPNMVTTRPWRRKNTAANKSDTARHDPNAKNNKTGTKTIPQPSSETDLIPIFPGQHLRTETCDIAEATVYWNNHVYPYFYLHQLSKSPWVVPIMNINKMKPYRQHALVTIAIAHRLSSLPPTTKNDAYAAEIRTRGYQHRSTAIQALNKEIENEETRASDFTLAGVFTFLFGDLMGAATAPNWRVHVNGFAALIALRGGWRQFCQDSPNLKALVMFVKIVENLANTTSPANDQLSPIANFKMRDVVKDVLSIGYYPQLPCPIDLFIDILQINRLRFAGTLKRPPGSLASVQSEAESLLAKVLTFSPEDWFQQMKALPDGHLLMARVYQSSVVLFGISSLQSVGVIPQTKSWTAARDLHCARLFSLLEESTANPALKICAAWPMVVAGFEAKERSAWMRSFILGRMEEDSQKLGIWLPLAAKDVLEKFYASAGRGWDDCFNTPHALFT